MDMTMRAATLGERLYTADQSERIKEQTGSLGYLRGDVGDDGENFTLSWENCRSNFKTYEFQAELVEVLDALRYDEQYGRSFKDLHSMTAYCDNHPESDMGCGDTDREFAFRADTAHYSYLIKMCPERIGFDFEIYLYHRRWLDRHMEQAEKGIRFITPEGREKFRVPDGGHIRIFTGGGETRDRTARYIDDNHVELVHEWGSNSYHIREFAERLERTGGSVIPMRSTLPDQCYSVLPSSGEIIIVKKGESGYYHTDAHSHDRAKAQAIVDECNKSGGVTRAQAAAMLAGSMFGWDTPAADPKSYDEQGQLIKPKHHDRDDAR